MIIRSPHLCLLLGFLLYTSTQAQSHTPPNHSFEEGIDQPAFWQLSPEALGYWYNGTTPDGDFAASILGDGNTTSFWRSAAPPFAPSSVYALQFYARSHEARGGTAISGPRFCNRDLGNLPDEWTHFTSIFATPSIVDTSRSFLRFGQWQVQGELVFDDVRLFRVQPVHRRIDGVELGAGENLEGDRYRFEAQFNGPSRNHSRPLVEHNCDFNTNRWVFGRESAVQYRHEINGYAQLHAQIEVSIGYYQSGALVVEARREWEPFVEIGRLDSSHTRRFNIPDALLPAQTVTIRLRSASDYMGDGAADPGAFQVVSYSYNARLADTPPSFRGQTEYAHIHRTHPNHDVTIQSVGTPRPGRQSEVVLNVFSHADSSVHIAPHIELSPQGFSPIEPPSLLTIQPGKNTISLPYNVREVGPHTLKVYWDGEFSFSASVDFDIPVLHAALPGHLLPGSSSSVHLWQIDSGWKVDRHRPPPSNSTLALYVSAAAGESEATQLVLSPDTTLRDLRAQVGTLYHANGDSIRPQHVDVLQVAYVSVSQPTDAKGIADFWPDPLLPLTQPIDLEGGINHPLWLRINVPDNAPPGLYRGHIALTAAAYRRLVPIELEVYGFSLPSRMSCSTAFGFSFDEVVRYHRLTNAQDKRRVLDLYLDNFARHHISPYNPAPLDPFSVSWKGSQPVFDWTAWDRAMQRAIDHYGFNSFRLPLAGLGGGDYAHRRQPTLNGASENDPRYEVFLQRYLQSIEAHLADRGWLDEAFVYFFDEPQPQDYAFVNRGFAKLARHAPTLRRMLTEQVEEALLGGPTIWCPLTPHFDDKKAQSRRAAGESFWWYICTLPKEPYAGLFIDRPGLELRTWLWQTWQHNVDGILIWQSNYWHSEAAYANGRQNPYQDPMSWVSSYSTAIGNRRPWGNGDGRFIYPPLEAFSDSSQPVLAGPVDSQRWEMLRDGIEDYEYFALLERLLDQQTDMPETERARYRALLDVPESISASLRSFSPDPAPLRAHRHTLARAIETLQAE